MTRPERLDGFMARAAAAYYAGCDPFGATGDFTTAPEISQAFGECLGLWAAVTWQLSGRPAPVVLAELGPGRGTLMADALRAIAEMMPGFRAALSVHLVETSPALRAAQARLVPDAIWHDRIDGLPPGPAIILANEFFDALPVRQFIRRGDAWRERFVEAGAWRELPAEAPPPLPAAAPAGAVLEHCEPALAMVRQLAARGATLLAIDYGPAEAGFGDSLQALAAHRRADPLAAPGSVDITAHVAFAALAAAARQAGAAAYGPLPMGLFLQRLGLMSRAAILARLSPRHAGTILSGAERLVAPEGMGRLFKALCLCHPGLAIPPGFEPA